MIRKMGFPGNYQDSAPARHRRRARQQRAGGVPLPDEAVHKRWGPEFIDLLTQAHGRERAMEVLRTRFNMVLFPNFAILEYQFRVIRPIEPELHRGAPVPHHPQGRAAADQHPPRARARVLLRPGLVRRSGRLRRVRPHGRRLPRAHGAVGVSEPRLSVGNNGRPGPPRRRPHAGNPAAGAVLRVPAADGAGRESEPWIAMR